MVLWSIVTLTASLGLTTAPAYWLGRQTYRQNPDVRVAWWSVIMLLPLAISLYVRHYPIFQLSKETSSQLMLVLLVSLATLCFVLGGKLRKQQARDRRSARR